MTSLAEGDMHSKGKTESWARTPRDVLDRVTIKSPQVESGPRVNPTMLMVTHMEPEGTSMGSSTIVPTAIPKAIMVSQIKLDASPYYFGTH